MGETFTGTVDLSTTGHALAGLVGFGTPWTFTLGGGQTILVNLADPNGELLALPFVPGPTAVYSFGVPTDASLAGFPIFTQALHVGGGNPFALSNALDLEMGY